MRLEKTSTLGFVFQIISRRLRWQEMTLKLSPAFLLLFLICLCIQAQTPARESELLTAVTKGDVGQVKELLRKGYPASAKNPKGITTLMIASAYGHIDIVEALLANGADLNEKVILSSPNSNLTMENVTAITFATMNGQSKVIEVLLAKGATVQRATENQSTFKITLTLLAIAACGRQSQTEAQLITLRTLLAKAEPEPKELREALYVNRGRKHSEVQRLLEQHGASIGPTAAEKQDPASFATIGKTILASVLLPALVDTALYDIGIKDIWVAAEKGDLPAVQEFLAGGTNANSRNSAAASPLIFAARHGYLQVAELLLAKGADVNSNDLDGDSPLMEATQSAQVEIVKLLIAKKADVNARNKENKTALKLAENISRYKDKAEKAKFKAKQDEIIQLLKSAGAK